MSTNIQDNELLNKVIDLELTYSIKNSELYLEMLKYQINFYLYQISCLENNKPFFFRKKKLAEHNKKINDYTKKIDDNYQKINEELELIKKMRDKINN